MPQPPPHSQQPALLDIAASPGADSPAVPAEAAARPSLSSMRSPSLPLLGRRAAAGAQTLVRAQSPSTAPPVRQEIAVPASGGRRSQPQASPKRDDGASAVDPAPPAEALPTVALRLWSNWGHGSAVGLSRVAVISADNDTILPLAAKGRSAGAPGGAPVWQDAAPLLTGAGWSSAMPISGFAELLLTLPADARPAQLLVWNFATAGQARCALRCAAPRHVASVSYRLNSER
jgi:hypothetical protein